MRKELVWAAAIGISFGLIIAFGAWRINSSLKSKTVAPTPTPTSQNIGEASITLDKPEDDDVVTVTPVAVSGITKPLSWITVSGEKGDYIIQSDETGAFSQDVDLVGGVNQIKITAFDSTGNQSSQKVLVVYSSSFQLTTIATPTPGTSTSESDIRANVAEKVAQALSNPKAYIGVVTDIADSTIQIKTPDSQIQQVSIGGNGITVMNVKGTNNKQIKLTDIAIGDFIVAMGYVNSNSVLAAQRILVTDPITEPELTISMAKVTTAPKKSLSMTGIKDNTQVTITPDKNTGLESYSSGATKNIKLTAISQGDLIIYVIDNSGTSPITRSVFDVGPSKS
jgi:hypothetical protein